MLISSCFFGLLVFRKLLLFSVFHIGERKYPKLSEVEVGEKGLKYETPKELILASIAKCITSPKAIPKNPAR